MSWKIFFSLHTDKQFILLADYGMIYIGTQITRFVLSHKPPSKRHCQIPAFPALWQLWGVSLRRREDPSAGSQSHRSPGTPAPFLPSPAPAGPAHAHPLETRPSALPAHHMRSKSWILEKQQRDHFGKDKTRAEFISSLWQQTCPSSWWSRSCCAPHSPGPLLSPCRMGSLWTVKHKGNGNFHWQVPQLLHFCIILIVLHNTDKWLFFHLAEQTRPSPTYPDKALFCPHQLHVSWVFTSGKYENDWQVSN